MDRAGQRHGLEWARPSVEVPGGTSRRCGSPLATYQDRYPGTHNKTGYDMFSKGPDKTGHDDDMATGDNRPRRDRLP